MAERQSEPISVIYPTCGRPQFLTRSIEALLAGDVLPTEIVVIDQSRAADTRRALDAIGSDRIVHVASDERGLSRARNLGLSTSSCPVVAFLDDDCVPARDWVAQAARLIRDMPGCSIWIGHVVYDERELAQPGVVLTISFDGIYDPWRHDPSGGNSFFRRTVFAEVGEFDPLLGQGSRFPGAEDGDMLYRVLKRKLGVVFSDAIRCFHIPWRGDLEKLDNRYNYGSGVGAMLAKHVAAGDRLRMGVIFVRHFLKKPLLVPYYRLVGPDLEYRRNLTYSRGLLDGFRGWRSLHDPQSRRHG